MRNIRSTFRTAAVAASTLALITGLAVTAAAPANASTTTGVSSSVVVKKASKPSILVGQLNEAGINSYGPVVQEFAVKFVGKWSGNPVKVTIHFDDNLNMADKEFTLNPVGNIIAPTGPGWTSFPVTLANPGDSAGCGGFTMTVQDGKQKAKYYVPFRQDPTL